MTSFIQVPTGTMTTLGTDIGGIADDVEEAHGSAQDCAGLDGADHGPLVAAVDGYRTAWNAALLGLLADLNRTGDQATAIGTLVAETDADLAAGLAPGVAAGP